MTETIGAVSLVVGVFFVFAGSVGVFRFEDVYLRLQASSKSITFGFGFLMLGAGLLVGHGEALAKALLAILFQFLTAPVAAQTIARAALIRGHRPLKQIETSLRESTDLEAP